MTMVMRSRGFWLRWIALPLTPLSLTRSAPWRAGRSQTLVKPCGQWNFDLIAAHCSAVPGCFPSIEK